MIAEATNSDLVSTIVEIDPFTRPRTCPALALVVLGRNDSDFPDPEAAAIVDLLRAMTPMKASAGLLRFVNAGL
jgi:hypothetical protein